MTTLVWGLVLAAAATEKPRIVVLDLVTDTAAAGQARFVTEAVMTELSRAKRFDVVGTSDIQTMLGLERQKELMGCSDADAKCMVEMTGALGADFLVTGSLGSVGATRRLDLKLIDTHTSRVLAREGGPVTPDTLSDVTTRALRTLVAALPSGPAGGGELSASASSGKPLAPKVLLGVGAIVLAAGGAMAIYASTFNPSQYAFSDAVAAQGRARTLLSAGYLTVGAGAAIALAAALWLALADGAPSVAIAPTQGGAVLVLGGSL